MIRLILKTAAGGAIAGALFAAAVVSFADCVGPHCFREQVIGILGHAGAGAVIGGILGTIAALIRRWRREG